MGKSDPCSGSDGLSCSPLQCVVWSAIDPAPVRFLCCLPITMAVCMSQNVDLSARRRAPYGCCGVGRTSRQSPCSARRSAYGRCVVRLAHDGCSSSRMRKTLWARGPRPSVVPKNERSTPCANDGRPRLGRARWLGSCGAGSSMRNATWLILPVVICLSQRLSHACVSMN